MKYLSTCVYKIENVFGIEANWSHFGGTIKKRLWQPNSAPWDNIINKNTTQCNLTL